MDERRVVATGVCDNGALEPLAWQEEIRIAGEFTWQKLVGIDNHLRGAVRHGRKHLAGPGNNNVAAKHEIGTAGGDADRMDVPWLIGKPNMAVYCAALLRATHHLPAL